MRAILIFILLFPLTLLAYQSNSVTYLYNDALHNYEIKNYEKSYELFHKIYIKKLMDFKFNFYYGVSAYKTKHYNVALSAFERAEIIDPNNYRVKLEIGRVYFVLGMYDDSKEKFTEVLNGKDIPKNVTKNIELYLTNIEKSTKKSFTKIDLNFALFYDSNINYGSLSDTYNIGENILPTPNTISDNGLEFSTNITNMYDFGLKNGYLLKNRFTVFTKTYHKNHSYDIGYISYNSSLIYISKKYMLELEFGIDNLFLDKKRYTQTLSFKPQLKYNHLDTLQSFLYLKFSDKFYDDSSLDAYQYEFSYNLQNSLNKSSYIVSNINYLNQQSKDTQRVDVDYYEYKLGFNYIHSFFDNSKISIYSEIKKRYYDKYSELFVSTRDDKLVTISPILSKKIDKSLDFKIKVVYNHNYSNQEVFSYKKTTISTSIVKRF